MKPYDEVRRCGDATEGVTLSGAGYPAGTDLRWHSGEVRKDAEGARR